MGAASLQLTRIHARSTLCALQDYKLTLHLARGINFTLGSAGKSYRYGVSGMINYTTSSLGYLAETIPTNNVKKNVERNQSELNT